MSRRSITVSVLMTAILTTVAEIICDENVFSQAESAGIWLGQIWCYADSAGITVSLSGYHPVRQESEAGYQACMSG